jgi:glycosyltransferase involved in cell wall biosynthesis
MSKPISSDYRPILVIANSCWYLLHYRKLLLTDLQGQGQHVMALAPVDSAAPDLSRILIHVPWRIQRSADANPLSLGISFLRMMLLVRAIKPRLVHSHTLKANLLAAVVTAIFGIPCVLSFAGMGRLSKRQGPENLALLLVLRSIAFFALRDRCSRWRWRLASRRTMLIFQNPIDQQLFEAALPAFPSCQTRLIPGSGVPAHYLESRFPQSNGATWVNAVENHSQCEFLFCGRLLRSKGINTFLELAGLLTHHRFTVYGEVDPSSKDSLLGPEIEVLRRQHPNVSFVGKRVDPLLRLQASFPVLVVPSVYGEGLPRAIVEALALRIPVLCSRLSTCGIFSETTLYVAESNSAEHYLRCFDRLVADHCTGVLRGRLDSGYNLVSQKLSERSIVRQTLNLYRELENGHDRSYLLSKDIDEFRHWLPR